MIWFIHRSISSYVERFVSTLIVRLQYGCISFLMDNVNVIEEANKLRSVNRLYCYKNYT